MLDEYLYMFSLMELYLNIFRPTAKPPYPRTNCQSLIIFSFIKSIRTCSMYLNLGLFPTESPRY
jgi:hypothetical protein